MRVLVTGASGFVGTALLRRLASEPGVVPRAAVRGSLACPPPAGTEIVTTPDLRDDGDWVTALSQVDAVIHLAGRAHVMRDSVDDPLAAFRAVNVAGTERLARAAASAGVSRFVFLSSVKVNGDEGTYRETDAPAPNDPYGVSKLEGETALRRISAETGLRFVIVRPPLVYGPGVKANFRALMNAIAKGVPLPFGRVDNRRSLIAVDNLADFLWTVTQTPAAVGQLFLVSDGEDLSTRDLIRRLARAMERSPRLLSVPPAVLSLCAAAVGRRDVAQRLLGSLQLDISKAHRELSWTAPVAVDEGLRRAAKG